MFFADKRSRFCPRDINVKQVVTIYVYCFFMLDSVSLIHPNFSRRLTGAKKTTHEVGKGFLLFTFHVENFNLQLIYELLLCIEVIYR